MTKSSEGQTLRESKLDLNEILEIFLKPIIENTASVIAYMVGTIIAVIATYYTAKSYLLSRKETEKTPKLKLSLYHRDSEDNVYFVLPFKAQRAFLIPLGFRIDNAGSLSAKNVEFFMEIHNSLYGRDVPRELSKIAAAKNVVFAAEEGSQKYMTKSYVRVGDIPPGESFVVQDEVYIDRTTILDIPVEATTKDNVKVLIKTRLIVALILTIKVSCEDVSSVYKELRFHFRKGNAKTPKQFLVEERKVLKRSSLVEPISVVFFEKFEKIADEIFEGKPWQIYRAERDSMKFINGLYKQGNILIRQSIKD